MGAGSGGRERSRFVQVLASFQDKEKIIDREEQGTRTRHKMLKGIDLMKSSSAACVSDLRFACTPRFGIIILRPDPCFLPIRQVLSESFKVSVLVPISLLEQRKQWIPERRIHSNTLAGLIGTHTLTCERLLEQGLLIRATAVEDTSGCHPGRILASLSP